MAASDLYGKLAVKKVTLSVDTSAHVANDVLAEMQEISSFFARPGGTGVIHSVHVVDADDQGAAMDIFFSPTSTVALGTENAEVSVSDADLAEMQGVVEVAAGDYVDTINNQIAPKTGLNLLVRGVASDGSATRSMYVGAVTRGTPTYSASGLTLVVGVLLH